MPDYVIWRACNMRRRLQSLFLVTLSELGAGDRTDGI